MERGREEERGEERRGVKKREEKRREEERKGESCVNLSSVALAQQRWGRGRDFGVPLGSINPERPGQNTQKWRDGEMERVRDEDKERKKRERVMSKR